MIITRTPFRLSLIGGGTDLGSWSHVHGGSVIGSAINKYSYTVARYLPPFFPHTSRFVYNEIELVKEWGEIKHRYIKAALSLLDMDKPEDCGVELMHYSDLPSQSGTGSSSSFAVGLIHSLSALKHKYISHEGLRKLATELEQEKLGETVGYQDQTFAAFGGFRKINFHKDGSVTSFPIPLAIDHIKDLEKHLLMIFTGTNRNKNSSDISKEYAPSLLLKSKQQWALMQMVNDAHQYILSANWKALGLLIDQSWQLKRSLSDNVSNKDIDQKYLAARTFGAWGGKIMGAGGGGCMLFIVSPNKRQDVLKAMGDPVEIKIKFDHNGSQVIYTDLEQ